MTNVKEITITASRTWQIKEFEPVRFEISYKYEVDPAQNYNLDVNKMFLEAKSVINKQIAAVATQTTNIEGVPDGRYIVLVKGVPKVVEIKGDKRYYNDYIKGDALVANAKNLVSKFLVS